MANFGHFFIDIFALDIIFKMVIIVISFNRAVLAQNYMQKVVINLVKKRF